MKVTSVISSLVASVSLLTVPTAAAQTNLWSYPTGSAIISSPSIGPDGTVYVGSYDQTVYAINPDGFLRWSTFLGKAGFTEAVNFFSSPAIGPDGTIYIGAEHTVRNGVAAVGDLFALDPTTGTNKWTLTFDNDEWAAIYSDPAIGPDGTIYVGCYDTNLYAINPDGTEKWHYTPGDQVFSDVAIGPDGTIYFGADDGKLYALDSGGTNKWSFAGGNGVTGSPAIGPDDTIYFGATWGANGRRLYAVHPDGTEKWNFPAGGFVESSPAVGSDGTIYVGSNDNHLYAIHPDGTLKWKAPTAGRVRSSPALAEDGTIYVGSEDGNLYAFDRRGTNLWSWTAGDEIYSSPCIGADGTIYVGSSDNNLHAIYGSSGLARSPWAMFHRNPAHSAKVFPAPSILVEPRPDSSIQLILAGEPGQNYEINTSQDLHSWQSFTNFLSPTASLQINDPDAITHDLRFYRIWTR